MSLCLAEMRTHFCTDCARGHGGSSSRRKYGTNCIIPEFVNSGAVGCVGLRLAGGTRTWPRSLKKATQIFRSSFASMADTNLEVDDPGPTSTSVGVDVRPQLLFPLGHGQPAFAH